MSLSGVWATEGHGLQRQFVQTGSYSQAGGPLGRSVQNLHIKGMVQQSPGKHVVI